MLVRQYTNKCYYRNLKIFNKIDSQFHFNLSRLINTMNEVARCQCGRAQLALPNRKVRLTLQRFCFQECSESGPVAPCFSEVRTGAE